MPAIRISEKLNRAVEFARFCRDTKTPPYMVAELVALATKATRAQVKDGNEEGHAAAAERAVERFEAHAKALGFKTAWPGLYPLLTKRGKRYHLPEV